MAKNHEQQPKTKEETKKDSKEAQPTQREQELIGQLQRLQAEFDNYRKRIEAESAYAAERGQEKLLKELLTVIDSMELALKHTKGDSPATVEHRQGLELIYSQFLQVLESNGMTRIPTEGPVDPRLHEVYITENNDTVQPNSILETLQQGYTRNGAVLRTAKVKAARRKP